MVPSVALPERARVVDFSLPHTETFDAFFVAGRPSHKRHRGGKGKEIVSCAPTPLITRSSRATSRRIIPVRTVPEGLSLVASGRHDDFLCPKLIGTIAVKEHA